MAVEYEVLGGPEEGPTLKLDYERFAYAGKFVMGRTGKAVTRDDGAIVAAASFDRDRTDPQVARIRYVTVRNDRRGEGIGARLLAFLATRLLAGFVLADVDRVLIAVNNAFAYEAAYKAGFGYTGERTGLDELVLARPSEERGRSYRDGISVLSSRSELAEAERSFLSSRLAADPPSIVSTAKDA